MNREKFETVVTSTWMWIKHHDKNLRWHGKGQLYMLTTMLFSSNDVEQSIFDDLETISALADKIVSRKDREDILVAWGDCK